VQLETTALGALQYDKSAVIHFPEGLLGFVQSKNFLLLELEETRPLRWLQSIEQPSLTLPVLDPAEIFPTYQYKLAATECASLDIANSSDVLTVVVAIIPEDPNKATVNLKAPVIINHRKMVGKQIVLDDPAVEVCAPLFAPQKGC